MCFCWVGALIKCLRAEIAMWPNPRGGSTTARLFAFVMKSCLRHLKTSFFLNESFSHICKHLVTVDGTLFRKKTLHLDNGWVTPVREISVWHVVFPAGSSFTTEQTCFCVLVCMQGGEKSLKETKDGTKNIHGYFFSLSSATVTFFFFIFYCFSSSSNISQAESSVQGCCNLDLMCIKTAH